MTQLTKENLIDLATQAKFNELGGILRYGVTEEALADFARLVVEAVRATEIDQQPFMYAIQSPDGSAYMDEACVCEDPGPLADVASSLNDDNEGGGEYKVVPVYTSPAPDSALASSLDQAEKEGNHE